MTTFLQWIVLTALTGSPLGAAAFLLVVWLVVDRFTLGLFPDPVRWVMRRRREASLRRTLLRNPSDRRARLELAELLTDRRAGRQALEVLRPNLERGDDDPQTLYTMGAACMQAGYAQQGETFLGRAKEQSPSFRAGDIDLALGEGRLRVRDWAGAREALLSLLTQRQGSVKGRVLLARAQRGLGDDAAAALTLDDAWTEYVASPRFQRRRERLWAWRARPSRPLTYALVLVVVSLFLGLVAAPKVTAWVTEAQRAQGRLYYDPQLYGPDLDE